MTKHQNTLMVALILSGTMVFLFSGCSPKKINNKKAMFLYQDGITLASRGNFDNALEKFNQSIAISEKNGFMYGVAHNYNEIGNIYTYKKNFGIAREYFQRALDIYKTQNMAPEVSKSMDNIAKTYIRQGDYRQGLTHYGALVSWDMASENRIGAGITTFNMGLVCEKFTLDYDQAKKYYQDALEIFLGLNREKEADQARRGIDRVTF